MKECDSSHLHPLFTKYTPLALFWWFFFRNVTKLYEFRNDTCFLSVMLRNLMDHVITPFLAFGMLQNLTDCVTMLPFNFRHVTEFHGLCNNASFWFPACYETSRIVQQWVQSTSKWSNESRTPPNNGPRTKLGYDKTVLRSNALNDLSYPNFVREPSVVGMRPSFDYFEVLGTHR